MQGIAEKINKGIARLNEYLCNSMFKIKTLEIDEIKDEIIFVYDIWELDDDDRVFKDKEDQIFKIRSIAIESDSMFKLYYSYLRAKEFLTENRIEEKKIKNELDNAIKEREALVNAYEKSGGTIIKKMMDSLQGKIDELAKEYESSVQKVISREMDLKNWENQQSFMKNQTILDNIDKNQTNLDNILKTAGK